MAKLLILFACALLPGTLAQCNTQRAKPLLARSAYEFAIQLSTRIAQEKENHFVASTLSAWSLLSSASLGAAGVTLDEFRKVLRLHKQRCFNDQYFELIRSVASDGQYVTMERSSTVFAADNLSIRDVFRRRIKDAGISTIVTIPFDDPEAVSTVINEYVSRETHDTINDLVIPTDLDGVYLIMIDALYFKGLWRTPFPNQNTVASPFYDDTGSQLGEVNMMTTIGSFNMSTISLIDATVLELPFGADGRYVMLFVLPRSNTTLSAVIDALMKVSLTTIYVIFAQDGQQTVQVQIPKFHISSDLDNLKELFSDMGLRSAFDSYSAEFPDLSDTSLYISHVVQKANIDVTETGAEASAATAGFFASRSGPDRFRADKPFFYMIVDTVTLVPVFTGAFSKPTL